MPKRKKRRKAKSLSKFFMLYSVVTLISFIISGYLFFRSFQSEPETPYFGTKECRVYDENGALAAYANVTLKTNASIPESNFPINVTLGVEGLYVPAGNWTYAVLEGATAAFPEKEPSDWNHTVSYVIVLEPGNRGLVGSRIMNYSFGQDWDVFLYVTRDTCFITHCIPPNPTNLPMRIYKIPNAIHIASEESVVGIQSQEESRKSDLRIKGMLAIVPGLGFLIAAIKELK